MPAGRRVQNLGRDAVLRRPQGRGGWHDAEHAQQGGRGGRWRSAEFGLQSPLLRLIVIFT